MYKVYKDKGEERWEVYAWAIRDAMSKATGLPTSDLPARLKLKYYDYLIGKTDEELSLIHI